jgi:Ca2+:H+ antiporter
MLGLEGRRAAVAALTVLLAVVSGVLSVTGQDPVLRFVVSGLALAGLAWAVSVSTEMVGRRVGPGATGVLQSTLGNLPELFVVVFALRAGQIVVAESSIVGSLRGRMITIADLRELVDFLGGVGRHDQVATLRLERWLRARGLDEEADRVA